MVGTGPIAEARRFDLLWLLLPGWIAFVVFMPSLTHGFVWDDLYFLVETPYLRQPEFWWQALTEPLFVSPNYYRPLPLASFIVELQLGDDAFVFHLTNLLLHACNVSLVVVLARRVSPQAPHLAGCTAGLIFGLHPAVVENVCWISDRFDLFMALFILLALCLAGSSPLSLRRSIAVALLFVLALLSKETAVILLVLLPCWQWLCIITDRPAEAHGVTPPVWVLRTGMLLATVFAVYLVLRRSGLGYWLQSDSVLQTGSVVQHLLLIGKTFASYLQLLILPFGRISPVHPVSTPIPVDDAHAWLGMSLLVLCIIALAAKMLRSPPRAAFLLLLLAFVALVPVLHLLPLTIGDNLIHDRYLLLPLAFAAIGLGGIFGTLAQRSQLIWSTLPHAAWCVASSITTVSAIEHWESDLSLWTYGYSKAPQSRIAAESYLGALVAANELDAAIELGRTLLEEGKFPPFNPTLNLAVALARKGQFHEAATLAEQAIDLSMDMGSKGKMDRAEALNLLGYIKLQVNALDEAESALREAIHTSPRLSRPHYNMAMLHIAKHQWDDADAALALALRYSAPARVAALEALVRERKLAAQSQPSTFQP